MFTICSKGRICALPSYYACTPPTALERMVWCIPGTRTLCMRGCRRVVCIPWTDPLMMQRVPMCGRFADYGVYHTLLVPNDVAAAKGASSIGSDAPIHSD
jgi:hypothetical protein